jgi:hypothetical protein
MKKILILIDGIIGKVLLKRLVQINTSPSEYDVIYMDDSLLSKIKPQNFTFYKFDPSSFSKLKLVMSKVNYSDALVVMSNKNDTIAVIENITKINPNLCFNVYNGWDLKFDNNHIQEYNALNALSIGLIERLPNVPVIAQNIGLKEGEIMEVKIPFGSFYAYRYISSIAQKEWKIFALYRNDTLVNIKPTLILNPNDIILIIGKPKVLIQVYNAISKSYGNFPMPFGKNIYVYLNLYTQSENDAINLLEKARLLTQKFKNSNLIVRITKPTTIDTLDKLINILEPIKNKTIAMDYSSENMATTLLKDKYKFEIGIVVVTAKFLSNHKNAKEIVKLKLPIFKVGTEIMSDIKTAVVVLNDTAHYEQISPVVFDIVSQLKYKLKVIDADPIGDTNRKDLIEHFDNLSKIFNQDINIDTNNSNPIKKLKNNNNLLQILPIQNDMFKRRIISFLTTNSDLLSYDLKYLNQILIPIIEDSKE